MTQKRFHFARTYILYAILTITVILAIVFVTHHSRIERLSERILLQQARALFGELVLTRKWVNSHGGVYVKVRPDVAPNPFLTSQIGVKATLTATDGSLYTLINPAIAVREISEISEKEGAFKLHVASLDPVSPVTRKPDNFERNALLSFEQGKEEMFVIEESEHGPHYRYMAPVKFDKKCNKCHAFQHLKQGDIRGGISISIPMAEVRQQLIDNRYFSFYSAIAVLVVLFTILAMISSKFVQKLQAAQHELELSASTDGLTELFNRKTGYERLAEELSKYQRSSKPLSCLMLDVDHFKQINDRYGHLVGDQVLKQLAGILKKFSREYDILCRYGGEEFLVILPETELVTALMIAERYREKIAETAIEVEHQEIYLTASIGVTQAHTDGSESRDSLIGRADAALYQAKEQGRDQIIVQR